MPGEAAPRDRGASREHKRMKDEPIPAPYRPATPYGALDAEYLPYQTHNPSSYKDDLKHYLNVLKKRKWYVLIPILLIMPFAALSYLSELPHYQTYVRILIDDDSSNIIQFQNIFPEDKSVNFYETEYNIITSRSHLEEVVDILKLDVDVAKETTLVERLYHALYFPIKIATKTLRTIKGKLITRVAPSDARGGRHGASAYDPADLARREAVARLYRAVDVDPLEDSKLVDIRVEGEDPAQIVQQANTLAAIYVRNNLTKRLEASQQAIDWLSKRTENLKAKMYETETELQALRKHKGIIASDIDEQKNMVLTRLETLHDSYLQAQKNRIEMENLLEKHNTLRQHHIDRLEVLPPVLGDTLIIDLKQEYIKLKNEYNDLLKTYKENHPIILQKSEEIHKFEQYLRGEISK